MGTLLDSGWDSVTFSSHAYTGPMADFSRFLPLSLRPRGAEDGVTSDRRAALADLIDQAAELVATAGRGRALFAEAFVDEARLRDAYDDLSAGGSPVTLADLAAAVRAGRRRSIRALTSGARALLLLARDLDAPAHLDPVTAGAIALHLAASAPYDRRAVVRGRTVRATDADWSFGHGPTLEGTATGIAAFLLGVSDDPPKPPLSDPG